MMDREKRQVPPMSATSAGADDQRLRDLRQAFADRLELPTGLVFDHTPAGALRHYEVGVRIGQLSLGEGFNGVLSWGRVDNRPFLRCLKGYGLCLWRLGRRDEAARVFHRILCMNPADNQGIRFLLPAVRDGLPWEECTS